MKVKDLKKALEAAENGSYEKLVFNYKKIYDIPISKNLVSETSCASAVAWAVNWKKSKEGFDYWFNIYNCLSN